MSADECEQVEKAYTRLIPSAPRYNYFSEIGTRRTVRFVFEDANLGSLIEHPKVMEVMRGNLLDELESPMSRQRWAKGVRPFKLLIKYPVRIAINPFI